MFRQAGPGRCHPAIFAVAGDSAEGRVARIDFFVHSQAHTGEDAPEPGPGLTEEHWSYMDRFARGMTARGPTLGPDRETWTGSLHVVRLPGPAAARDFADYEPYNRAGLFERHTIWRFVNVLGRTMWQFAGVAEEPFFLVLARAPEGRSLEGVPARVVDLPSRLSKRFLLYGELRDTDDNHLDGIALALQAPTREDLDALLREERLGLAGQAEIEVHDWELGGRR